MNSKNKILRETVIFYRILSSNFWHRILSSNFFFPIRICFLIPSFNDVIQKIFLEYFFQCQKLLVDMPVEGLLPCHLKHNQLCLLINNLIRMIMSPMAGTGQGVSLQLAQARVLAFGWHRLGCQPSAGTGQGVSLRLVPLSIRLPKNVYWA